MHEGNAIRNVMNYLERHWIDYTGIGFPQPEGEDWKVAVSIVTADYPVMKTLGTYVTVSKANGVVGLSPEMQDFMGKMKRALV